MGLVNPNLHMAFLDGGSIRRPWPSAAFQQHPASTRSWGRVVGVGVEDVAYVWTLLH